MMSATEMGRARVREIGGRRVFDRLMMLRTLLWGMTALTVTGCADDRTPSTGGIESVPLNQPVAHDGPLFESLPAERTGVDFENRFDWAHQRKNLYLHGYAGGGVCIGDYDDDDRPDIFLLSQTGQDRLYRQVADLEFVDVTAAVGLGMEDDWGTGAVFADVDDDGDLDLFVCNYAAPNRLYVNQGDGTFIEAAEGAGLAFNGASVMGAFADYDRDGDLDLHVVTNRLYPGPTEDIPRTKQIAGRVALEAGMEESFAIQERLIDGEIQKFIVKAGQRDRLYRNNGDGTFTEVSEQAGMRGNEPGLSATWWDYDGDDWPDLYVCNDFWDPDHLYRNNGDGTFSDVLRDALPHTPWFSMGSDAADVDNDGRMDFLVADMSPTTHFMSKMMMGDMIESRWFLESAEPRQYMRNALYLNTGTPRFMEVAYLAGLSSTDWTWSVKFGDLDNDGWVDLFVTNGTSNHSFDPDLTRRLLELGVSLDRLRIRDPVVRWEEQWRIYRQQPPRREMNHAFRNGGDLRFENESERWGLDHNGISFGAAYSDLDRDGDLDLVVSNVEDPVSIYRNHAADRHRILVQLRGVQSNRFGIGATLVLETASMRQSRHLAPTGGYMSADEPLLHFGVGDNAFVDTLTVRWPSGHVQRFEHLEADQRYTITEPAGAAPPRPDVAPTVRQFQEVAEAIGITSPDAVEIPFDDYARQPLLPARLSQLGPGMAWGDVDGDGNDDLFVGGPTARAGRLWMNQGDGTMRHIEDGPWAADIRCEDTSPVFFDADADGDVDLYVASGGIECEPGDSVLRDRLYLNDGEGSFSRAPITALPDVADSTGVAVVGDYDRDGDLDLFVGSRSVPGQYPTAPNSRILRNDGGRLVDTTESLAPGLARKGMVTSALWTDADNDGWLDLLVTHDWGPVSYWRNTGAGFEDHTARSGLADRTGWWNGVTGADLDGDGDLDYLVMNAGLNTKYDVAADRPAVLFHGDFQGAGNETLVEATRYGEDLLPVRGRSCSSAAMPFIQDLMPTYRQFASATLTEIYTASRLEDAGRLEGNHLASGVLVNEGVIDGSVRFSFQSLPRLAQVAPAYGVVASDFDGDGHTDVYIVQNFSWREPETGRWNSGLSLLLRGDGAGGLVPVPPDKSGLIVPGDGRGLAVCDVDADGWPDVALTQNNDRVLVFRNEQSAMSDHRFVTIRLAGRAGNPTGVGARVTVARPGGPSQTAEVYGGGGYMSQSSPALFFGCGSTPEPLAVRVRWPDGATSNQQIDPTESTVIITQPPAN